MLSWWGSKPWDAAQAAQPGSPSVTRTQRAPPASGQDVFTSGGWAVPAPPTSLRTSGAQGGPEAGPGRLRELRTRRRNSDRMVGCCPLFTLQPACPQARPSCLGAGLGPQPLGLKASLPMLLHYINPHFSCTFSSPTFSLTRSVYLCPLCTGYEAQNLPDSTKDWQAVKAQFARPFCP